MLAVCQDAGELEYGVLLREERGLGAKVRWVWSWSWFGSRASSGEESIVVAKVASLLRYVSTRKLPKRVCVGCETKRLGEADVRLKADADASRESTVSSVYSQSSLST